MHEVEAPPPGYADEIQKQEELIKGLESNPVYFIEVFLERELSSKQKYFCEMTQKAKHIVNIWSRQTGKSTVIASYIVWRLLYGKGCTVNKEHIDERIAIVAPIKEQHVLIYDKIKTLIDKSPYISNFVVKLNSERIIMKNGNRANFMSASPGSHIRGYTATCIVIDESQDITDSKYSGDVLPFGATTNALILEAGTPKTKNHFYNAMNSKSVTVIKQPWFECPFLSKEYVMAQKSISPEALWRQEYLCEFMEEGVLAFPSSLFEPETKNGRLTRRWNLDDYVYYNDIKKFSKEDAIAITELVKDGATYTAGLDLGKQNDNSVFTIVRDDLMPLRLGLQIVFPLSTPYKKIASTIGMLYKVFQWHEFNFDYSNEKGFVEMLIDEDVPAVLSKGFVRGGIPFSNKNKAEMVTAARVLLEKFKFQLPKKAEKLLSEFLNQQYEVNEQGLKKYYHPSNENDDSLWSTLLALKNVKIFEAAKEAEHFVNPWEQYDDDVHGIAKKSAKEVVFSTAKIRSDNRTPYVTAAARRRLAR